MDGTEAAALILKDHDIPVLFCSSHTGPDVVEKTEKVTSYGYVAKSSSNTVLDASIKMAFKLFEANNRIRNNEKKRQAMITGISDVIAIIKSDGVTEYISPNTPKNPGMPPESLIGKDCWTRVHPEDAANVLATISALQTIEGASTTLEYRFKCGDSRYRPVELTATNLEKDPTITGILLNSRDISERKKTEEARDRQNTFITGRADTWTEEGRPLMMLGTHTDITERKVIEEENAAILAEKDLILSEMNYRAKNTIVNELPTNCVKHAFPKSRMGTIRISATLGATG